MAKGFADTFVNSTQLFDWMMSVDQALRVLNVYQKFF